MIKNDFSFLVKHRIKRLFQKISIKSQRKMVFDVDKDRPESPYSTEAFSMCKYFITRADSVLTMSTDGTKYIDNNVENVNIMIRKNLVEIVVNKTYIYDIVLKERVYQRVVRIFDNNLNMRRKVKDDAIINGVKYSLKNIYETIKNKENQ